jgi:hypothetical protein
VPVANASKATIARFDVRRKNVLNLRSAKICEPDDSRDEPTRIGGDDRFSLAYRAKRYGTIGAVAKAAFNKDRRHNPMAALRVSPQLLKKVPTAAMVPQVMMGVTNHCVRLKNWFHKLLRYINPLTSH